MEVNAEYSSKVTLFEKAVVWNLYFSWEKMMQYSIIYNDKWFIGMLFMPQNLFRCYISPQLYWISNSVQFYVWTVVLDILFLVMLC